MNYKKPSRPLKKLHKPQGSFTNYVCNFSRILTTHPPKSLHFSTGKFAIFKDFQIQLFPLIPMGVFILIQLSYSERERSSKFSAPCTAQHQTSTTSLSLNIIAILKWILPLESVEKVVSKSECRKLFQLGLNYHNKREMRETPEYLLFCFKYLIVCNILLNYLSLVQFFF